MSDQKHNDLKFMEFFYHLSKRRLLVTKRPCYIKDSKENKTKTKEHEHDCHVQVCFNTVIIIISYFRCIHANEV